MPKPAVVIVVRHGARLDAADKQWHLTSPTPYDPPLTYGGWQQAKALGLRIAALLHARENETKNGDADATLATVDAPGAGKAANGVGGPKIPKKKKKHKVVLHSSPFQRCIQTSTGIAAGMAQFQPPKGADRGAETTAATKLSIPRPSLERNGSLGSSVLAKSPRSSSPAVQPAHSAEHATDASHDVAKVRSTPQKTLLRIDAFLGEWLSPDYFEDITPPPNSTMMVAGAKADLLRRGDYIEVHHVAPQNRGHFPGGWKNSSPTASRKAYEDSAFLGLGSLGQALPHRERSSSGSGPLVRTRSRENAAALATAHKVPSYIYDPPIPSYAVSTSDPIPRGYVSHARDACVDVDWQWDSMREPQEWGDGGEYGDEWSTMHKRFRRGLAGMMKWYEENGSAAPQNQFRGFTFSERPKGPVHSATDPGPKAEGEKEDEDEDLVLVLVTHGAGCNALLGAISNQPILIDVGLAALSMAVRRDEPRRPPVPAVQRRPSVVDPGMSDTYEMKYLASLDHLRPGVDPAKLPQSQSPAVIASPSLDYRRRMGFNSGGTNSPISGSDSFTLGEPLRSGWNSALGSIRRSSTSGSTSGSRILSSTSTTSPMTSSGLWTSSRAPTLDSFPDGRRSPGADMVLNFANHAPKPSPSSSKSRTSSATSAEPTPAASIPALDGASSPDVSSAIHSTSHDDDEKDDCVAPLRRTAHTSRSSSMSTAGSSGLWTPKNLVAGGNGLWGPPIMEEVFEHRFERPKRRWTVSDSDME